MLGFSQGSDSYVKKKIEDKLQKVLLQLPARVSLLASLLVGSWGQVESGDGWFCDVQIWGFFFSFVFGTGLFYFVFCSIFWGYYFFNKKIGFYFLLKFYN